MTPKDAFIPEIVDENGDSISVPGLEAVTTLVTQTAQLAQLARIRKSLESQSRAGADILRIFRKSVEGPAVQPWNVVDEVGQRCNAATIINEGPDPCYVCLNDLVDGFQPVPVGSPVDFDFHRKPVIERLFFKCDPGGQANLRIPLEWA